MDNIEHFSDQYDFLSNFYPSEIEYQRVIYPTVEHAFQAAKTHDHDDRVRIAALATPGLAKQAGRRVELRPDWEIAKFSIMHRLLHLKFQDEKLAARLIATYPAYLEEGNTWGDRVWGTVRGVGQNRLGRQLMIIRAETILADAQKKHG